MRLVSLVVVTVALAAATATCSSSFDVIQTLAQTWALQVTKTDGSNSTTKVQLQRSLHFADVLTGEFEWPVAASNDADSTSAEPQPSPSYTLRIERTGGQNTTALLLLLPRELDESADLASQALASIPFAVRETRAGWIASGAFKASADLLGKATDVSFILDITGSVSFHLTLQWNGNHLATIVGAGDAAPPQPTFWQRWGPSALMLVMFTVMRAFTSYMEYRQEEKAVITTAMRKAKQN